MFLNAVADPLLQLIAELSHRHDIVDRFYLAGGTALALQCGHRTSVDLDFFSQDQFNSEQIATAIIETGGQVIQSETYSVHGVSAGVKMSFFHYPYPLLQPLLSFQAILIASVDDIAAMKAVAISQRGDKKDFFDMYEILKKIPPSALKRLFLSKFSEPRINCYHILKSFFYFDDADLQPDPISLNGTTWEQVKTYFTNNEKQIMKELLC